MTARRSPGPAASSAPGVAAVVVGLAVAMPALAGTFRGPRESFWKRMTATGLALGAFSLLASPSLRRMRIRLRDVGLGLTSAATLYLTFRAGDRFARRFVPGGPSEIQDIYSLRELGSPAETALRLTAVIAPAEELFWRGLVQEALMRRYGRWRGAVMATLAYSAAHVSSGNFTLFGAAGVAGTHWSVLYAAGVPIGALVVTAIRGATGTAIQAAAAGRLSSSST